MKRLILPVILICAALLPGCNGPSRDEIDLAARMNALAAETNREAHLAFDPEREALVSDFALELVKDYRLITAYRPVQSLNAETRFTTYRMVHYPGCRFEDDLARDDGDSMQAINEDRTICRFTTQGEAPPQGAVVATSHHRKLTIANVATIEHRIVIRRPDGQTCGVLYYSAPLESRSERLGVKAVAAALGLAKGHGAAAGLPGKDEVESLVAANLHRATAATIKALEALAATGRAPDGFPYAASKVPPAAIAANADGLIQQLDLSLARKSSVIRPIDLARTLALLPDVEWARRAPQILSLLGRHSPIDGDSTAELLIRLSELGPPALPVLAQATSTRGLPTATVIGACKIGPAATPVLGPALLEDWRRENVPIRRSPNSSGGGLRSLNYRACVEEGERNGPPEDANDVCWQKPTIWTAHGKALYFALKRMGLGADADRMAKHVRDASWKRDWGDIGPSSPVDACTDDLER